MDVDVELVGSPELVARLDHAAAGVLSLGRDLAAELTRTTAPMAAFDSVAMRARPWGTGDVWTLPAGAWVAARDGRVHLPDSLDDLTTHVQELLDGN